MSIYLYHLKFNSPIHFGKTGIGLENTEERLSSDALTSAIINAFSILGGVEEVVEALQEDNPPFILSSLFPFGPIGDSKGSHYALPRPLCDPQIVKVATLRGMDKDLRRIKYLSPEDCSKWIADKPLTDDDLKGIVERSKSFAKPGKKGSNNGWWIFDLRPRVSLDRVSQNSSIWLCGTLHFADQAGLYGLVRFNDEKWKPHLANAFKLLGDLGLGGERTYGMGNFTFSDFELPNPEWQNLLSGKGSSRSILLSLYYPLEEERQDLAQRFEAWDFVERKGYVVSGGYATTLKRRRVWMFTEGSVAIRPVQGCMADVTPDGASALGLNHKVHRSGLAFFLPFGGVA
jgi:CRISPR-associated protein Csm4